MKRTTFPPTCSNSWCPLPPWHDGLCRAHFFHEDHHPTNPADLCEDDFGCSAIRCPNGVAFIPNFGGQELVGAAERVAIEIGRALLLGEDAA